MKTRILYFVGILLLMAVSLTAQKKDYSNYTGYVEFGDLSAFENNDGEATEILIEEHLLKMVAKVTINEEPELSDIISGIKLIRVHSFETDSNNYEALSSKIMGINDNLTNQSWDRIVRTKSNHELVNVFIKTVDEEIIEGLVVTTLEKGREAVFVNIVGNINLETIGRLGDKFDLPGLNDFQ